MLTDAATGISFVFDYHTVLEMAREYDRFGSAQENKHLRMSVGLTGYEIWRFSQRLKDELAKESNGELLMALTRIVELEAEVKKLQTNVLLASSMALSAIEKAAA